MSASRLPASHAEKAEGPAVWAHRGWRVALVAGAVLLFVALLGPALVWWFRAAVFTHLVGEITDLTRWNDRLVKAAVLALGVPFFWALGHAVRPHWPALTREQRRAKGHRRGVALACLLVYAALFYLATGFATRELYFDRRGRPLKYCIERPSELYCEDRPGFDPNGARLVPVTREMAGRQALRKRGQVPRRVTFANSSELDAGLFFGPDGGPRIWFGRALTGEIELFDRPGYHPVTGRSLEAVSVDLLRNHRTQLVARERAEAERLRAEAERQAALERQAQLELQAELERHWAGAQQLETPPDAGALGQAQPAATLPAQSPGSPPPPSYLAAPAAPPGGGCLVLRSELPEPITVVVERRNRELTEVLVPAGAAVQVEGPLGGATRVRAPGNPRQGWRKDLEVSVSTPPGCTSELLLRRPLRKGGPIRLIQPSSSATS